MRAHRVFISFAGALWLVLTASAADKPHTADSLLTVPSPLQEYYYRAIEPERLTYAVDLWYDAVLKGDDDLVIERESVLLGLLQQDLDSSGYVLQAFDRLLLRAQAEAVELDTAESLKDDYPILETLERNVYAHARQDHQIKKRLYDALCRTPVQSNKYRLMSDYIEVLRRQVGLPRLQLAMKQDTSETGQGRLVPVDVRVTGGVAGASSGR